MYSLVDKRILILGLGISGFAAAKLALREGARVSVLDSCGNSELEARARELSDLGASLHLGWNKEIWKKPVDLAVVSPGIVPNSSLMVLIENIPCPKLGEIEFGFLFCKCPVLAVTGTNGKTTSVELIVHCLSGAGYKVVAAGNIGYAFSEAVQDSKNLDFIIAEISSFQLEMSKRFAPSGAVILNISQDHLDRHTSQSEYINLKLTLIKKCRYKDTIVLQHELLNNSLVNSFCSKHGLKPITFSSHFDNHEANFFVSSKGEIMVTDTSGLHTVLRCNEFDSSAKPNIENVLATLAACKAIGVEYTRILPHLKTYSTKPHRQELIAENKGVKYVNDSKSTNPDAMIHAIIRFGASGKKKKSPIILIAGGKDKNLDFNPVVPYLKKFCKIACLIGELRDTLEKLWQDYIPCRKYSSLDACIDEILQISKPGDVVLFSPGSSSFDMFRDYIERGLRFNYQVKRRLGR